MTMLKTIACAGAMMLAGAALAGADAATLTTLFNFCNQSGCKDGRSPDTKPLLDSAGNIFGSLADAKQDIGLVYQLTPNGGQYTRKTLKPLDATGDLIMDTDGNLYGTTPGGKFDGGMVFELVKSKGYKALKLYSFCPPSNVHCNGKADGDGPVALTYQGHANGALFDGTSPLYGVTTHGGTFDKGLLFTLTKPKGNKWKLGFVHSFCDSKCKDGIGPNALIMDSAGMLYGTTNNNGLKDGNVLYKMLPTDTEPTVLYTFCKVNGCPDGGQPRGVALDESGNIYGTAFGGGAHHQGVLYRFSTAGTYTQLHDFCAEADCADGSSPMSAPMVDGAGNVIGTTRWGGGHDIDGDGAGGGTVYIFIGGSYNVLYAFCAQANCADGEHPFSGVTLKDGQLYGTTLQGGPNGLIGGTVFRLAP